MKKKEKNGSGAGNWQEFWNLLKQIHLPWGWIGIAFLCNLLYNQVMLKLPTVTAGLLSGSLDSKILWNVVFFYVTFAAVLCGDIALRTPAQHIAARNARRAIWKRMLHIRMDYYDMNNPSDMMSTITNDTTTATQLLVQYLVGVIPTIYYVVAALKTISDYNFWLMLSVFMLLPIKIIYAVFIGRCQYKTQAGLFRKVGGMTAYLAERVRNLSLIKTYTNESQELKNGEEAARGIYDANMKVNKLQCLITGLSTVIGLAQTMIVMVFGVVLLKRGAITIQQWAAFYMFSATLSNNFSALIDYWTNLKTIQGTMARTGHLLNAPEEIRTAKSKEKPKTKEIVFDKVSFSYGEKNALNNVSFTVPAGSSTAVIGLCGSGKTTALSLIERFYEAGDGKVTLGGVPVSDMGLDELRGYMGYVQQGAEIFSGTVREALTYGLKHKVSDEEIWKAARLSGFSDSLKAWEHGLDTQIAAGGSSLSGGQRQKLVLTREFMRDTELLLLDEPTSALDAAASAMVQNMIFSMFKERTKVIVTHDLSLIERVDQIIVLDNGALAGCGTYEQLSESCQAFRSLVQACREEKEAAQ